jgi:hypothetical protein
MVPYAVAFFVIGDIKVEAAVETRLIAWNKCIIRNYKDLPLCLLCTELSRSLLLSDLVIFPFLGLGLHARPLCVRRSGILPGIRVVLRGKIIVRGVSGNETVAVEAIALLRFRVVMIWVDIFPPGNELWLHSFGNARTRLTHVKENLSKPQLVPY